MSINVLGCYGKKSFYLSMIHSAALLFEHLRSYLINNTLFMSNSINFLLIYFCFLLFQFKKSIPSVALHLSRLCTSQ